MMPRSQVISTAQLIFAEGGVSVWHTIQFGLYPQAISDAVDALLPSLPRTLTSTLSVQGQPFVDSTFYLPYLPYAPQKALANIFSVYRRYLFGVTLSCYTVLHHFHVQYTTLHITPCCTTVHHITLHYTVHYITLHHVTPHYITLCYTTLHLHCIMLHFQMHTGSQ